MKSLVEQMEAVVKEIRDCIIHHNMSCSRICSYVADTFALRDESRSGDLAIYKNGPFPEWLRDVVAGEIQRWIENNDTTKDQLTESEQVQVLPNCGEI